MYTHEFGLYGFAGSWVPGWSENLPNATPGYVSGHLQQLPLGDTCYANCSEYAAINIFYYVSSLDKEKVSRAVVTDETRNGTGALPFIAPVSCPFGKKRIAVRIVLLRKFILYYNCIHGMSKPRVGMVNLFAFLIRKTIVPLFIPVTKRLWSRAKIRASGS